MLGFHYGQGSVRVGPKEGLGEPGKTWRPVRDSAVRFCRPPPRHRRRPTHEPAAEGRTDFPSPAGRGWPEGPGEGETARSWALFVATARLGGLSHSSSERRYYCFGLVENGIMTVRFTYRNDVIRIFGAGYWRKGKKIYERENKIHRRTHRKPQGRS